jgi:spermidine synthase
VPGRYPIATGTAELVRDLDRPRGWLLTVDGVAQSYVDLDDPGHLEFEYIQLMADVITVIAPAGAPLDVVHVGGAGCTLARYVAATRPGSRQVVFEPDAGLVALVRTRLGLPQKLRVRVQDAAVGLRRCADASADLVIGDAFTGSAMPVHLAAADFVRQVARVLRPAGCYVLNVADGAALAFARAEAATLAAVFPHLLLTAEPAILRMRRFGNLVFTASRRPLPAAALSRRAAGAPFPARVLSGEPLRRFIGAAQVIDRAAPMVAKLPTSWGKR